MIRIAPPMILLAILLLINAIATEHLVLRILDLFAAIWLLWNSIDRIDPPTDFERHSSLYSGQ